MATYRSVASTETDPQAPVTSSLMKALEANPTAISEGASGAPRIQFEAMDAWYSTANAVGTYVFAMRGTGTSDIAFGGNTAGSNLVPCGAFAEFSAGPPTGVKPGVGSALSGTWKCMGNLDHSAVGSSGGATLQGTLWLRIS